jgi:Xaa-Pro dipeptidase
VDFADLGRLYRAHVADLTERYASVLQAAEVDAVVIHSGFLLKRSEFDDQYWPLRATPHFQHWLPLAEPDCALVVEPGKKPKLGWMDSQSFWERPRPPESDHFTGSFDISKLTEAKQMSSLIPMAKRVAFVGEARADAAEWGIATDRVNPPSLVGPLDRLRAHKTAYEVACIDEANRRAAGGHKAVLAAFRSSDISELELHLHFLAATSQDDPETPYKNIVALGPHAATLHHVSYAKRTQLEVGAPQSLLVDAGATFQGYCSDITRTWVKGDGAAASTFLGLVERVEAMQQRLCAQIKIGLPYEELHEDSHRQLAVILRDVGIVRDLSAEQSAKIGITRSFYPHGLGHSLGLQCHDVGCALVKPKQNNPYLRNTSTITQGQVFTIEPGVYFIDPLLAKLRASENSKYVAWPLVEELRKLGGIRIEDDLVVTGGTSATRNLTRECLPVGGGR